VFVSEYNRSSVLEVIRCNSSRGVSSSTSVGNEKAYHVGHGAKVPPTSKWRLQPLHGMTNDTTKKHSELVLGQEVIPTYSSLIELGFPIWALVLRSRQKQTSHVRSRLCTSWSLAFPSGVSGLTVPVFRCKFRSVAMLCHHQGY
jgi:hypothetical protein